MSWEDAGACRGQFTGYWFDQYTVEFARSFCERCPVRRECLAAALDRRERYGVWGGVDFTTRAGKPLSRRTRARLLESVR